MPVLSGRGACFPVPRLPVLGAGVAVVLVVSRVLPDVVVVVELTVWLVAGSGLVLWSEQAPSARAPISSGARRMIERVMGQKPPFGERGRMKSSRPCGCDAAQACAQTG